MRTISKSWKAVAVIVAIAQPAAAFAEGHQRTGWGTQVEGLAVFQGEADLDDGGDFTANRAFLRGSASYAMPNGGSAGVSLSYGTLDYDFSLGVNDPWQNIRDVRISAPVQIPVGSRARALIVPQLRWDYESDADASDGYTYGVFAGISWQINDRLRIGPAFGAFSQLDDDGTEVFPALLVDWEFADRWQLSTGGGLGATQGPGLTLSYAATDALSLSLSARSESIQFRLDDDGLAPGGVGSDESLPVVFSVGYEPNPGVSMSAFVGAEFGGELTLDDANGNEVSSQSYDTAPIAGVAVRLRF